MNLGESAKIVSKKEIYTGQVETVAKGGSGIVFLDGKPVFIEGVIPGERVAFSISKQKRSVSFGRLHEIIQPAKERIVPACPYYGTCGGCNFQHIDYDHQLTLKKDILLNNLQRIGKVSYSSAIGMVPSPPFRYRTRTTLKIRHGKVGYFKRESHDIVEVSSCHLLPSEMEKSLPGFRHDPWVKKIKTGDLFLLANGSQLSALGTGDKKRKYLSKEEKVLFDLGDFDYTCAPGDFIQANRFTLQEMINLVRQHLVQDRVGEIDRLDHAVDLFCGCGFFTLPLALAARQVTAVEMNPANILSLENNLERVGVDNVQVLASDVLQTPLPRASLYLVDPPRAGLGETLAQKIMQGRPHKIIYFSCDSATFSRDARFFVEGGYHLDELKLIDNFPQTDHFEIFSVFQG